MARCPRRANSPGVKWQIESRPYSDLQHMPPRRTCDSLAIRNEAPAAHRQMTEIWMDEVGVNAHGYCHLRRALILAVSSFKMRQLQPADKTFGLHGSSLAWDQPFASIGKRPFCESDAPSSRRPLLRLHFGRVIVDHRTRNCPRRELIGPDFGNGRDLGAGAANKALLEAQ